MYELPWACGRDGLGNVGETSLPGESHIQLMLLKNQEAQGVIESTHLFQEKQVKNRERPLKWQLLEIGQWNFSPPIFFKPIFS